MSESETNRRLNEASGIERLTPRQKALVVTLGYAILSAAGDMEKKEVIEVLECIRKATSEALIIEIQEENPTIEKK